MWLTSVLLMKWYAGGVTLRVPPLLGGHTWGPSADLELPPRYPCRPSWEHGRAWSGAPHCCFCAVSRPCRCRRDSLPRAVAPRSLRAQRHRRGGVLVRQPAGESSVRPPRSQQSARSRGLSVTPLGGMRVRGLARGPIRRPHSLRNRRLHGGRKPGSPLPTLPFACPPQYSTTYSLSARSRPEGRCQRHGSQGALWSLCFLLTRQNNLNYFLKFECHHDLAALSPRDVLCDSVSALAACPAAASSPGKNRHHPPRAP